MPYIASPRPSGGSVWLGRFAAEVEYAPAEIVHRCGLAGTGDHRQCSVNESAQWPDRERDERSRSVLTTEGLLRAGERVMAEVEALEVAKARLEADLLAAYGALHSIQEQQVAALARGGSAARMAGLVSAERVVAEEIALATGVGAGEVARRLTLATAPRRHRRILAALRSGGTSLHRGVQVASETVQLSDAEVAAVEEAVLAPSRDGRVVGQRTFSARLRRAMAAVEARGAEERRAQARSRRGVFGRMVEDGMGCLTITSDAASIAAVLDRLDTNARTLRGSGDPRTLDQLRCDLATDALLRAALTAGGGPRRGGATGPVGDGESAGGPEGAPVPFSGDAAARVWLVVPFEVATGDSDAACELPGHGWVTAAHAREIMTRPGSVWQTLPVDLRDGHAINRPTQGYRPTRAMVEHVQAVDGTCRGPDCHVPASRCDLDHETPWPKGQTAVTNLHAKERRHHNAKTHRVWTSTPVQDHGLEWTTLTGRGYTTYPKDWREGLGPPGNDGLPPF